MLTFDGKPSPPDLGDDRGGDAAYASGSTGREDISVDMS
jgi:hypothetical protein